MKILRNILVVVFVGVFVALMFYLINKEDKPIVPVPDANTDVVTKKPVELCFAMFSKVNERGFYDKYTLRALIDGEKVSGELNFLPGEKDSKVGKFTGTVSAVDKTMMARTMDIWWDTFGEGIYATEQLKIIFGEGVASIGAGELVDRGDGVYVYKDTSKIYYNLHLNDVDCDDLTERENVSKYVKDNISTLSPVKAVLGGTWYVLSNVINVNENSGVVMYEDGHIQEKRNYTYSVDEKRNVINLIIK